LKTRKKIPAGRFLVLLPHRESRKLLENYRRELFAAGCKGAHSFPPVAFLAGLSRPMNRETLKIVAQTIRENTVVRDGKITAGCTDTVPFPQNSFMGILGIQDFSGPSLDLSLPDFSALPGGDAVMHVFPKIALCASVNSIGNPLNRDCVPFSFRAAIITNLLIRPLENGAKPWSFQWRLGPECWLPAFRRKTEK